MTTKLEKIFKTLSKKIQQSISGPLGWAITQAKKEAEEKKAEKKSKITQLRKKKSNKEIEQLAKKITKK